MDIREIVNFWRQMNQEDYQTLKPFQETLTSNQRNRSQRRPFSAQPEVKGLHPLKVLQSDLLPMEVKEQIRVSWNQQSENLLTVLHRQHGNKWSVIASHMAGRSQNCIKNKFYSTLRKGFRKINKYISNIRKRMRAEQPSNNKPLRADLLTKLSAVADRNYQQKYEVKTAAIELAQDVQSDMIELARNNREYQKNLIGSEFEIEQGLLQKIFSFRKNCKKRKGKRKSIVQSHSSSQEESSVIKEEQIGQIKNLIKNQVSREVEKIGSEPGSTKHLEKEAMDKSIDFQHPKKEFSVSKRETRVEVGQPELMLNKQIILQEQIPNLYEQNSMTPLSMASNKNSLYQLMESSPFKNHYSSFGVAFMQNLSKLELSAPLSNNSELLKGQNLAFIERVANTSEYNAEGISFFKSSQLNRVNESTNLSVETGAEVRMCLSEVIRSESKIEREAEQQKMMLHASSIVTGTPKAMDIEEIRQDCE